MHFSNAIQHYKKAEKFQLSQLLFLLLIFSYTNSGYAVTNEYFKYQLSLNGVLYDSLEEAEAAMMSYNDQSPYLELVNEIIYKPLTQSYGAAELHYDVLNPEIEADSEDCYKHRLLSSPCYQSEVEAANAYLTLGGSPYVIVSIDEANPDQSWSVTYYYEGNPTYCKQSDPCITTVHKEIIYSCSLPGYRLNNDNPPLCTNYIYARIFAKFPSPQENGNSCDLPLTPYPINLATGNKFLKQTDYVGEGTFPLKLVRYYNSYLGTNPRSGNWAFSFDYGIRSNLSSKRMDIRRPNGQILVFSRADDTIKIWTGETQGSGILELLPDNTFLYKPGDETEEYYSYIGNFIGGDVWRISKIKHISGLTRTYSYDSARRLEKITDSRGNQLTIEYSTARNIARVTVPGNRVFTYHYNRFGNIDSVSYPDGTTKIYLYEDAALPFALTGVIDERNIRYATYDYDATGKAISSFHGTNANLELVVYGTDGTVTLTNGRDISSHYAFSYHNGIKRFAEITGPGCTSCGTSDTSYHYFNVTGFLQSKIKQGITNEYGSYDSKGNPGYMIQAAGASEARRIDYTYDPRFARKVKTITEPSVYTSGSKVTTYDYDDFGNITRIRIDGFTPNGSIVGREINLQYLGPLNQLSQIDGPRTDVSDIVTLDYYANDIAQGNNRARLKSITTPLGVVRSNILYSATGKVSSETRLNGVSLTYSYYSGNDRLQSITENDGTTSRTTYWTYLPTGEVETITRGYGTADAVTMIFGYDAARRLTSITDGLGNRIQYQLDTEGNKEKEDLYDDTNTLRKSLTQTFDDYNRLNLLTQANESRDNDFNADGTLARVTDGNSVVTDYGYDALKRLVVTTQDVGGADVSTQNALTLYGYNVDDHLTSVTDPNDGTTTYIYDDLGSLLSQNSPDTGTTHFTYDAAGNVSTKQDAKGQSFNYSYDALNRLVLLDAPGTVDDIAYTYDSCTNGAGRLCQIVIGDGTGNQVTTYSYDGVGHVISHQGVVYSYDVLDRVRSMNYPSSRQVVYNYNIAGQVSQVELIDQGQSTILASNMTYAPFGPVTDFTYGNGKTLSQGLDPAYRFTSHHVTGALQLTNNLYDGNGNLLQVDNSLTQTTNVYNYDALNRLDTANGAFGDQDFGYDKNGNRLSLIDSGNTLTYSYAPNSNRLDVAANDDVILDANGNTTRKGSWMYTVNSHNRLTNVSNDAEEVGRYAYNGLGQRIYKDVTTIVKKRPVVTTTNFTYGLNGELLSEETAGGVIDYVYLNGQPVAMISADQVYYVHNDHLGTPRAITDTVGDVMWTWDGDPFGSVKPDGITAGKGKNAATFTFNLRFTGQYYDAESGLHYNYIRYYDPSTGRYVTSDPIGLNGGMNTYAYVGANPLRWIDSNGLDIEDYEPYEIPDDDRPIPGPFGGKCGPQGSNLATWIPDVTPRACENHDKCYDDCAKKCGGFNCKISCDITLGGLYGIATAIRGHTVYDELEKENGCGSCGK